MIKQALESFNGETAGKNPLTYLYLILGQDGLRRCVAFFLDTCA